MARKPRGQVRTPGGPGPQQHSQPPRPQGGGGASWAPLRDSVRRDIEQASSALAFAAALHDRLEAQRRLFADFPRVMEQLRSGALERVATSLARLFEGKDQFDLTRFLRDLPLALAQLAAAEAARKGPPQPSAAAQSPAIAGEGEGGPTAETTGGAEAAPAVQSSAAAAATPEGAATPEATSPPEMTSPPEVTSTAEATPAGEATATPEAPPPSDATAAPAPVPTPPPAQHPQPGNGGAPAEPPSRRLELRSRLLAAGPQLGKAIVTYRRTVATVRRAAAPRRAPGPWRSDREVLEEARLAVEFARQLFDAYAEAWADQPTQPGSAEMMSAETDRFLAWTQLVRYMDLAAPRSQPPPPVEKPADKQPATQGSAGAGAGVPPTEAGTAQSP
ncbi:MAG TPA: hypothetical protein VKC58_07300 [Myxococcales bacterium]|nr:hypothetical protein [Myxococcales bacterium]